MRKKARKIYKSSAIDINFENKKAFSKIEIDNRAKVLSNKRKSSNKFVGREIKNEK